MLGLEAREALRAVAQGEPRRQLLGQVEEVREVPLANRVGLARLHESGLEELAYRFEHPVAGVGGFVIDLHQRLVDEPSQDVEHAEPIATRRRTRPPPPRRA